MGSEVDSAHSGGSAAKLQRALQRARRPAGSWVNNPKQTRNRKPRVRNKPKEPRYSFISARIFFFLNIIFFCWVKNLGCSRCGWIKPVISGGLLFNQAATSCQFLFFSSSSSPLVAELPVIPHHQTAFVACKKKCTDRDREMSGGQSKSREKTPTLKL